MKRLLIVAGVFLLVAQIMARQAAASEGFEDLVKVVKSGTDDKVLTDFINASPVSYALSEDERIYLEDLGVSPVMIKAVVQHQPGGVLASPPPPAVVPQPETAVPPPAVVLPPAEYTAQATVVTAPTPVAVSQPVAEEPPPAVSLPSAVDCVQETVVDAPVVTAPPSGDVDVSTFYGALSPYGSWVNIDGTQYWQPTAMVVDSSWSPYCQRGHWVYTDCGWLWQSDYSWGWAPFHYGRWSRHYRYGWIWMPDTEWGPAWVSWRHSDTAIGWAPLPPGARYKAGGGFYFHGTRVGADFAFGLESRHFTFVPVAHFSERVQMRSRLPRSEVNRVYNTTTIIDNNYTFNGNRIVNRGPSITHIQEVTHQDIKQVRIVDQHIQPGQPIRRGTISGESVAVYRPHVAPTARETPQTVVARRQADVHANKLEATRKVSVFGPHEGPAVVQIEEKRGIISRAKAQPGARPLTTVPPGPSPRPIDDVATRQRQAEEAATRQRNQHQQQTAELSRRQEQERNARLLAQQQEEQRRRGESLARQQEVQRQQAAELARQQTEKRNTAEIARQREEQQRRAEELRRAQEEQQRRATELAREQELQRQRAQEQARQQEALRRTEEQARQQEVTRQRAAEQSQAQQRAWQAQRQSEEAAAREQSARQRDQQQAAQQRAEQASARQREQQQQQQQWAVQQRTQQSAFQSGNSSTTSQASSRGSASRGGTLNPWHR